MFSDGLEPADVYFLCLGHGESKAFLAARAIDPSVRIIDLSQDFRLGEQLGERLFVYGLPELNRALIQNAGNVANPGCFATAIQLGLLPLAKAGLLPEVHTTGITGSTGAGQKLQETTHFTWRSSNISAYKTLSHQHLHEIRRSINQLDSGYSSSINFIPWRGDFTRGIFVSSAMKTELSLNELYQLYGDFYAEHPFTIVSDKTNDMKQVVNTNKFLIGLENVEDVVVVHSAIDNLIKGASGQAVQNMNLMMGLSETHGLKLKSIVF
jgi:N-acetyl-gamma-glutamyl-phosphate reductase